MLKSIQGTRSLNPYEVRTLQEFEGLVKSFPKLDMHSYFTLSHADFYRNIDEDEPPEDRISKEKEQLIHDIVSPIEKVDEYVQLRDVLAKIANDPATWAAIAKSIERSPAATFLSEVTQRIEYVPLSKAANGTTMLRKILKVNPN